jgi:glycosyltransferase involved in cell wall biosynthesis
MSPYFSIVVPVYNVSGYVTQALNSLKNQSFKDFEVIVVNDGSTDDSKTKASTFVEQDDRFKLIDIENSGLGIARNRGLEYISGQYLMFLDSDDLFHEALLQEIYNKIHQSNVQADVVVFDIQNFDSVSGKALDSYIFDEKLRRYSDVAWNKAYRAEFFKRYNFQFPGIKFEDTPLTHIIMALAENPIKLNFKGYNYRRNRVGSLTNEDMEHDFSLRAKSLLEFKTNIDFFSKQLIEADKKDFVESKLIKAIIYLLIENRRRVSSSDVVRDIVSTFKKMRPVRNALQMRSIKELFGSIYVLIRYRNVNR